MARLRALSRRPVFTPPQIPFVLPPKTQPPKSRMFQAQPPHSNHGGSPRRPNPNLRFFPIPQPLLPFVPLLIIIALVAVPFIYAAFKAVEWNWWAEGLRIGRAPNDLRFASDLRRSAFVPIIWRLIGVCVLLTLAFAFLAGGLVLLARPFGIDATAAATAPKQLAMALSPAIVGYAAYVLAFGVAWRIYMVQRVWKIVVSSLSTCNLSVADHVVAKGEAASAIGVGLANSLDVAGF